MGKQVVRERGFLPSDQPVRTGASQTLWQPLYDTPYHGKGKVFDNAEGEGIYNDKDRVGKMNLCNLEEAGKLSNDAEFHAYGLACEVYFEEKALFALFNHFVRLERYKGENVKINLWMHLIGSAGGLWVVDNNAGYFSINKGMPSSGDYFRLFVPWIFPPNKTFKLVMRFMQLEGVLDAEQPAALFNAAVGTEAEKIRLIRFYVFGKAYKDVTA